MRFIANFGFNPDTLCSGLQDEAVYISFMSDWLIAAAAWVMVFGSGHRPWKNWRCSNEVKIFGIF